MDAIVIKVCGANAWGGAPAGFEVQWLTQAQFQANGNTFAGACSATFSGPNYALTEFQGTEDASDCVEIQIGKNAFNDAGESTTCPGAAPLLPDTQYVFRARALGTANMPGSDFTGAVVCTTSGTTPAPEEPVDEPIAFDPPYVFCAASFRDALVVKVCGANAWGGAPEGFVLQWSTDPTFNSNVCSATLTAPTYALTEFIPPNEDPTDCVEIQVGKNAFDGPDESTSCPGAAPLQTGVTYYFRAMALGNENMPGSGFSGSVACTTDPNAPEAPGEDPSEGDECEGCTFTQGYWKNHPEAWPVSSLTLGNHTYSQSELLRILNQPTRGNGLVSLARQLIAAKLNIATFEQDSCDDDVEDAVADADALIGDLRIPPIGNGSLHPSVTSDLNDTLTEFNEGALGPGHCDDSNGSRGNGRKSRN